MHGRKLTRNFEMTHEYGLLARPAAMLARTAGAFDCEVSLIYRAAAVNAKSLLGLLSLAVAHGERVSIMAEGSDAREAMDAIARLFACGFESSPTPRSLFAALSR
jgi:phosphotransferase system HPr (HPr) family protein